MNDKRFDDVTRRWAALGRHTTSRRSVMRGLGLSTAALFESVLRGCPVRTRAQDATPVPVVRQGHRMPGGRTIDQTAFEAEYDIESLFTFVRDQVRYDPYAGALRGAKGTLWGLAGNSVDQALLIAGLLRASLVRYRFVFGTLADEVASRLLAAAQPDPTALDDHERRLASMSSAASKPTPELSPDQQRLASELETEAKARGDAAQQRLANDVSLLTEALSNAGIALPVPSFALPERERTQHVWLQYAAGPTWIDLDPSIPGAKAGEAFATPVSTVDQLPDELYHLVRVRIAAEKIQGGQPVRGDLLAYEARSEDLVGVPLTLLHMPPDRLKALGLAISGIVEGTRQYVPHLGLGSTDMVAADSPVTFVTEGAMDAFGSTSSEGDTLAEWLEIDLLSPDAPPVLVRVREVFDRVGIERRAAGSFAATEIPPVTFTDLGGDRGSIYLPLESVWSLVVAGGQIPPSYFDQDFAVADLFADFGLTGHSYHVARAALSLPVAKERGHRFYADATNVTAFTVGLVPNTVTGLRGELGIDLLHQSVAAAPVAGIEASGHPLVTAGVLGHVAERFLVEPSSGNGGSAAQGVGRVFEEATRRGVPIRTLIPNTSPEPNLAVSDRARVRIAEALASGYVVVVPEKSVKLGGIDLVGWWQIDPATGETFDLMETGRGTSGIEYADTVRVGTVGAPAMEELGTCIGATIFITAGLTLAIGGFGMTVGGALANNDLFLMGGIGVTGAGAAGAGGAGTTFILEGCA